MRCLFGREFLARGLFRDALHRHPLHHNLIRLFGILDLSRVLFSSIPDKATAVAASRANPSRSISDRLVNSAVGVVVWLTVWPKVLNQHGLVKASERDGARGHFLLLRDQANPVWRSKLQRDTHDHQQIDDLIDVDVTAHISITRRFGLELSGCDRKTSPGGFGGFGGFVSARLKFKVVCSPLSGEAEIADALCKHTASIFF